MGVLLHSVVDFLTKYEYLDKSKADSITSFKQLKEPLAAYQRMDANVARIKEMSGTPLLADGVWGPATELAMQMPRCSCGDKIDAALGTGGWAGCHGADGYHKAIAKVVSTNMPSFLKPVFKQVLVNTQKAYAEVGLLWVFVNEDSVDILTGERVSANVNTVVTFTRGSGWIGLAIVGNGSNQSCSSQIWAKFDYSYQPRDVVTQWTTLFMHELGHNAGLSHSSGGVMNPSIVNGLSGSWVGDPSYGILKRWFGGPIQQPPDIPTPPVPPVPPPGDDIPGVMQPLGAPFVMHNGITAQLFRVFGGRS